MTKSFLYFRPDRYSTSGSTPAASLTRILKTCLSVFRKPVCPIRVTQRSLTASGKSLSSILFSNEKKTKMFLYCAASDTRHGNSSGEPTDDFFRNGYTPMPHASGRSPRKEAPSLSPSLPCSLPLSISVLFPPSLSPSLPVSLPPSLLGPIGVTGRAAANRSPRPAKKLFQVYFS